MSDDKNEHSSDLEIARVLSDALGGWNRRGGAPQGRVPGGGFTPFRARRSTPAQAVETPPPAAQLALDPTAPWDTWVEDVRSAMNVGAAWVVDGHGFLVGRSGEIDDVEAETAGIRIIAALDQAERLPGGTPDEAIVVSVAVGTRTLSGVSAETAAGRVTLILDGAMPPSRATGHLLATALKQRLTGPPAEDAL